MELRQFKYLLSIAKEGTLTAAADKLYISQSAISQQVKSMEEELGVQLFDRSGQRLRFTEAGKLLHQRAQRIVKEVDGVKKAIDELEELYRGTLTIGVVQTVNAYLMPRVVSFFSSQFPDIQLKIQELAAPEIEHKVQNHELDVGISFNPTVERSLTFDALFEEDLLLIVNPNHEFAEKAWMNVNSLDQQKLILLPEGYCTRRIWEDCVLETKISPEVQIEMNTINSLLAALEKNITVGTILPALTMQMKVSDGLKAIKLRNPIPCRTVGMLWRNGGYRSVASKKIAEVVKRKYKEIQQGI
ncbi:LysR substrate-binding domain-containing protein [Aliifodinibius salicampi]|uniref:LysR substrate-binding domain-containing protein n=1 Tax=Fodinibius salicampi TaxID=1920655 RepID=A0ABT3PYW8_9BACT|nr:LysR substrate-binding domain-containing protein [Fodinibius salicampi]MCW9713039.1 LysR substrate-binding domain-containing protein [Fodinibius salicampi]